MNVIADILNNTAAYTQWRKQIHSYPEIAFQEDETAEFVAQKLASFGIDVTREIGGTGLVGTLTHGDAGRSVGLRADMDALPMKEMNDFAHRSKRDGCMHACGHDGHTVMLLAAAEYLAKSRQFNGTVQFIFQPAEETGSGAQAMIKDGLFERFNMDAVFSMHNAPSFHTGTMATSPGGLMASMEVFEVSILGHGTHGAFPHTGNDPLVIASHMHSAWQSIVSRNINPQHSAVVSVTSMATEDSWNIIPDQAVIKGCVRYLSPEDGAIIKKRFVEIAEGIAATFGARVEIEYRTLVPLTYNSLTETELVCDVAADIVGESNVLRNADPVMGSEDFAYMLAEKPGCYFWLGATDRKNALVPGDKQQIHRDHFMPSNFCMLHESEYDFNDQITPIGASIFSRIVEKFLA